MTPADRGHDIENVDVDALRLSQQLSDSSLSTLLPLELFFPSNTFSPSKNLHTPFPQDIHSIFITLSSTRLPIPLRSLQSQDRGNSHPSLLENGRPLLDQRPRRRSSKRRRPSKLVRPSGRSSSISTVHATPTNTSPRSTTSRRPPAC